MKKVIFTFSLLIFLNAVSFAGENYQIDINGHTYDIGLDKEKNLTLPDGMRLKVKLSLKEYVEFQSESFSFSHKSIYKPNRGDIGSGLYQTMITTPLGTAILIQEYTNMDPSPLVDMMIKELTKEEVKYGYKLAEREVVKIVGRTKLSGKEAITKYKDEGWTRVVLAYGKKDAGLLIVTMIEQDNVEKEKHLIDHFWETLRINLR